MYVAIIGSRGYPHREHIEEAVRYLCEHHPGWKLVSGGARGVDKWAEEYAADYGVPRIIIKPDWSLGRDAGFQRNREIVAQSDLVIAFWDGVSHGTANSMGHARALGKELVVINSKTQSN